MLVSLSLAHNVAPFSTPRRLAKPGSLALSALLLLVGQLVSIQIADAEEAIDFNRDIRPLINRCTACHGPDEEERSADLQLDVREGATRDLGGYAAIVPGDPEDSEFIYRLRPDDPDDIMPPKGKGEPFSDEEVDLIRRWIASGADYAVHWAYETPKKVDPPENRQADWPRNSIDRFILRRLESEGLRPSPEADKRTLIRRVALDLTGLPPTPEEVSQFLEDRSDQAYDKMVDRFLAKPAYGEHWARQWLDLARYADSAGYPSDPGRTIWAYHDWVIRAFNQNLSFEQFTIDQIAGDLVGQPSEDQLIATAFHRNTMTQNEGGTSDEEFRNEAVVDRVNTTLAVWMGTSMACAQCHTHKYDPITHHEYFQVFAILNNTADSDKKDERPFHEIWTEEQEAQKSQWTLQAAALRETLNTSTFALEEQQANWEARLRHPPTWTQLEPKEARAEHGELEVEKDGSVRAKQLDADQNRYTVLAPVPDKPIRALRLEIDGQDHNFALSRVTARWVPEEETAPEARFVRVTLPGKGKHLHLAEVQVFSEGKNVALEGKASQISTGYEAPAQFGNDGNTDGNFDKRSTTHTAKAQDPWWEVDLGATKAIERIVVWNRTDGGQSIMDRLKGYQVQLLDADRKVVWEETPGEIPAPSRAFLPSGARQLAFAAALADFEQKNQPAAHVLLDKPNPKQGWAVSPKQKEAHELTLLLEQPFEGDAKGGHLEVTLEQHTEYKKHLVQRFALSTTDDLEASEFARLPRDIQKLVVTPDDLRGEKERQRLASYYRSISPTLKGPRDELAKVEKQLKEHKPFTSVPIMVELEGKDRRKTHVQIRGNFQSLGDEVQPGVPAIFNPLPEGSQPDRLGLAKWLVAEDNPLTARTIVNRYWEQIFGTGIVRTSEEFGTQGELPTHPELLDWLAVEFMESGWDMKHLLKLLVSSSTYRQVSPVSDDLRERDPENRLLARGPRFRPTGELLRDQALAYAGLLSDTMFGKPVRPVRPSLGLKLAFGSGNDWETSKGEDRHRRSVYTEVRRNSPYPTFATFDAPNREVCTLRRGRTNTPLQAFVTLNDPVFVEAAQGLARRLMKEGGQSVAERLIFA